MGPKQAAEACRLVAARSAVPVHWQTLHVPVAGRFPRGWMDLAGPRFEEALAHEAPSCRPLVLDVGSSATLP